jgi:hypothetical protein
LREEELQLAAAVLLVKQTWTGRGPPLDAGFDHDRRREQDAAVMIPLLSVALLRADTLGN